MTQNILLIVTILALGLLVLRIFVYPFAQAMGLAPKPAAKSYEDRVEDIDNAAARSSRMMQQIDEQEPAVFLGGQVAFGPTSEVEPPTIEGGEHTLRMPSDTAEE